MPSIYHEVRYERVTVLQRFSFFCFIYYLWLFIPIASYQKNDTHWFNYVWILQPMSLAPASLTESALRRLEECNTKLVSWGPLPQVEALNAQNRLKVMTALLFVYNQQLSRLDKSALEQLCKVATKWVLVQSMIASFCQPSFRLFTTLRTSQFSSRLVTQGFTKPGHHQRSSYGSDSSFVPRLLPRIPVSAQFLLEFLHAIYFAMYVNEILFPKFQLFFFNFSATNYRRSFHHFYSFFSNRLTRNFQVQRLLVRREPGARGYP